MVVEEACCHALIYLASSLEDLLLEVHVHVKEMEVSVSWQKVEEGASDVEEGQVAKVS